MEVLQLQQLLAAHTQSSAWQSTLTSPQSSSPFDLSSLQLQLLLLTQQQNCPPVSTNTLGEHVGDKTQRSSSLNVPQTSLERQPFRDLHSQVYGINPPQGTSHSKLNNTTMPRSLSGGAGRWTSPTDQRDVIIAEQLALIKNLNETITKQKQAAVEQDAVRAALEATIADLRHSRVSPGHSRPASPSEGVMEAADLDGVFPNEAQVAYYKQHAEQWSHRAYVDRQQLVQVLRTLIASNKRYQQPLPPMCVKPECRCRNCWFLHAQIDETAWAAAWELHMSLR